MVLFTGLPSRGEAYMSEDQTSQAELSPQAQTAPHYEAACSCALLKIKATVYSTHPNGA